MRLRKLLCLCTFVLAAGSPGTAGAGTPSELVVQSGQTLWGIAQRHGCSVEQLRKSNGLRDGQALVKGRKLDVSRCRGGKASASTSGHRVVPGDTLGKIAARHDTTVAELRRINALDGDIIRPGETLAIPGSRRIEVRVRPGQSRGKPHHGSLRAPARLSRDPGYYRRRPERTYAAQHVVDHLHNVLGVVRDAHPKSARIAIGDLSDQDGGALSGHASHQSGRDVDVGLVFEQAPAGYPQEFVPHDGGKLDVAATWSMVDAFAQTRSRPGGVEKMFLDYELQGILYEHARKRGVSRKHLGQIFQYPNGRWTRDRLVMHEPKHDDHVHVRFRCPKGDDLCR